LEQLAIAACNGHVERVIEIGPGKGALTRRLLARTDKLHAVELDAALAAYLRKNFASETKLEVHEANVLETDLTQWGPAVIAGNLPYYITSPIIEKFLSLDQRFPVAVFLMQWEVAERLLANPGTRDYGYLTVATRLSCDVELICEVAPSAFAPPPKVNSGAIRFRRKTIIPRELPELLKFVGRCFAHKRKTLRNNLRQAYGERADMLPEAGLRAEQIPVEQFVDLYTRIRD